jgi:two-component system invasion response regulator UvrY
MNTQIIREDIPILSTHCIPVLIVDDHALMRLCLRQLLMSADDITIIGEVASGEEAIKFVREFNPQVVLMDLQMPGIGGLEATSKIIHAKPSIKVIAVTICDDDPFPYRFIQAGGSGYITKNTNTNELVTAIHRVTHNQHYITPVIAQNMALLQINNSEQSPFSLLSERELQVMWMITHGDRVNQIADKLYLSAKTINTYRYRLFEKLHVTNDVALTLMALHYGIIEKELN